MFRRSAGWCALLLALAGCDITLHEFTMPAQVGTGQVFEILLVGSGDFVAGGAGAVLQVPNGFTVEGADGYLGTGPNLLQWPMANGGMRDAPALVSLMAPEPGHYVVSFHHADPTLQYPPPVALRVYVRAPAVVGGPHAFKVVAAGSVGSGPFQVTSPAGVSSFAQVTSAPYVRTCSVVAGLVGPFAVASSGLFAPGVLGLAGGGVQCGDLDGDGDDDLATSVWQGGQGGAALFRADGGRTWTLQRSLPNGQQALDVAFGDFDADGHQDLIDSLGRVSFGDGGHTWTAGPNLALPGADCRVGTGDVDRDGRFDLAIASGGAGTVRVYRSNGDRTFTAWSSGLPASGVNAVVLRPHLLDLTRDGFCDLVVGLGNAVRVFAGDGAGHWTDVSAGLPAGTGFAAGDVDGDGLPELLVSGLNPALTVQRRIGVAWQNVPWNLPPGLPTQARCLALLDYDRDGRADLAVGSQTLQAPTSNTTAPLVVLRNLGAGFAPPLDLVPNAPGYAMGFGCDALAVGDFDGDTWPDLAAVLHNEHVRVFHNLGSGVAPFGEGCGAPGFPLPTLGTVGALQVGSTTFGWQLQHATPAGLAVLWVGFSNRFAGGQAVLPFDLGPLGAPGCRIFAADDAVHFLLADANGAATLPMGIPNDPSLRLLPLFGQGATIAAGANALGLLVGNAVVARIP